MIPEEAVQAAALRIEGPPGKEWDWYLTEARDILTAAAPYLGIRGDSRET